MHMLKRPPPRAVVEKDDGIAARTVNRQFVRSATMKAELLG